MYTMYLPLRGGGRTDGELNTMYPRFSLKRRGQVAIPNKYVISLRTIYGARSIYYHFKQSEKK